MSEARFLSAFYFPKSKRFVTLTGEEVANRCGLPIGHPDAQYLIKARQILEKRIKGVNVGDKAYRLSPAGERRVLAMVVCKTLPKHPVRLTGNPQEERE